MPPFTRLLAMRARRGVASTRDALPSVLLRFTARDVVRGAVVARLDARERAMDFDGSGTSGSSRRNRDADADLPGVPRRLVR